jgi:galactonate dehydratase
MKIVDLNLLSARVGIGSLLLLKVETDNGLQGWGEVTLGSRALAADGLLRHYREFLLGKSPMQRARIWQETYRSQYIEGGAPFSSVIGAVDIALHDIVGQHLGVPVFELLGGAQRDFVPLFGTTSAYGGQEMLEQATLLQSERWNVIRLGFLHAETLNAPDTFEPRTSLADTAEWINRIRAELGHEAIIGIDYHHRLSVAEAASFCQMLDRHALDFLEEPIRAENPDANAALRRLTPVPFAIGEEFGSKWAFRPYLERDLLGFARLDVGTVGGFTEAMKVAAWAETHYVDVMPHNAGGPILTAASAHFAMAVPNMAWLEYRESPGEPEGLFYDQEIFPVQPHATGPCLRLSDEPGLGVSVDEAALTEAIVPTEGHHLRRHDGSVTNA